MTTDLILWPCGFWELLCVLQCTLCGGGGGGSAHLGELGQFVHGPSSFCALLFWHRAGGGRGREGGWAPAHAANDSRDGRRIGRIFKNGLVIGGLLIDWSLWCPFVFFVRLLRHLCAGSWAQLLSGTLRKLNLGRMDFTWIQKQKSEPKFPLGIQE